MRSVGHELIAVEGERQATPAVRIMKP